jgi:hypothetical protein
MDHHRASSLTAPATTPQTATTNPPGPDTPPQLPLAFSPGGVDALILLGILRDLIVDRRIYKVYLYAFPLLILFQIFCMQTYLHASPWWVRIATALLR